MINNNNNNIINNEIIQSTIHIENISECYICLEPCFTPSICGCKNTYIHDNCLFQLIKETKKTTCTICNQPIKNLKIKKYNKIIITRFGKTCICLYFLSIGFLCISMIEYILYKTNEQYYYNQLILNNNENNENNGNNQNNLNNEIPENAYSRLLFILFLIFISCSISTFVYTSTFIIKCKFRGYNFTEKKEIISYILSGQQIQYI